MDMVHIPKDSTNCEASKLCPEKNVRKDGTHVALNTAIHLLSRPCFVLKRTMVQPALETVEVKDHIFTSMYFYESTKALQ